MSCVVLVDAKPAWTAIASLDDRFASKLFVMLWNDAISRVTFLTGLNNGSDKHQQINNFNQHFSFRFDVFSAQRIGIN